MYIFPYIGSPPRLQSPALGRGRDALPGQPSILGAAGFSRADSCPCHSTLPTVPPLPLPAPPASLHIICDALIRATEANASFLFSPFSPVPPAPSLLSWGLFFPLFSWFLLY